MTRDEKARNPKSELATRKFLPRVKIKNAHSDLGFRASFAIRHSGFGLSVFPPRSQLFKPPPPL